MFFSNLNLKNEKRTFINVLFSKIQNTFEKTLHHSLFKRPPSAVCDLVSHYIMLSFLFEDVVTCTPLCSSLKGRRKFADGWSKSWGGCFWKILFWYFWGMFLIFGFYRFYRLYIFFNKYYKNIYKNIIYVYYIIQYH
jgi:hypothetical protein